MHLIEKYFQEVLHCFTITNIRLKGGKEIDLLAINPKTGEKFHVESRVATSPSFKLRLHDTYTKKGRAHRRGIDFFVREKFNHSTVVRAINEIFGDTNYRKMLVVYDIQDMSLIKQAKEMFDIEILFIMDLLDTLIEKGKMKGSRDDILRIVELMALEREGRWGTEGHKRRLVRMITKETRLPT